MITVLQLTDWIVEHRRGTAFQGYDKTKIMRLLCECVQNNSMLCITDNDEIVGVICCKIDNFHRTLYVYDILTTKKGVVKRMLKNFHSRFENYTIEGKHKTGRMRHFTKTNRLEKLLSYGI